MAAMRDQSSRTRRSRGRNRSTPTHTPGADAPRDDALPLEDLAVDPADAPEPPAARGRHPVSAHLDERAESAEGPGTDGTDELDEGPEATEPVRHAGRDDAKNEAGTRKPAAGRTSGGGRKSGRKSVPSWDDIMFGGGRGGSSA